MRIVRELARRQVLRLLATYTAGMTPGQLYAHLDCAIPDDDFAAVLDELRSQRAVTEDDGKVRLADAA